MWKEKSIVCAQINKIFNNQKASSKVLSCCILASSEKKAQLFLTLFRAFQHVVDFIATISLHKYFESHHT